VSTIAPGGPAAPTANATPTAAPAPAPASAITILEAPATLRQLATRILLDAVVQSRDARGTTTLATELGKVVLRLPAPPPQGATLRLDIGPGAVVQLAPASGDIAKHLPAPAATAATSPSARPPVPPQPTAPPAAAVTPDTGTTITARIIAATPIATASPATTIPTAAAPVAPATPVLQTASTLPSATIVPSVGADVGAARPSISPARAGDPISATQTTAPTTRVEPSPATAPSTRVGSGSAPEAIAGIANQSQAAAALPRRAASAPEFRAAATAGPGTTPSSLANAQPPVATPELPAGSTLAVRIAAPISSEAIMRPLDAQIVARLPNGQAVLDTKLGRMTLALPPDLAAAPPGTKLALEFLPESVRVAARPSLAAAPTHPAARHWPALHALAGGILERADPASRELAERILPKPGPRLAAQLMTLARLAEHGVRGLPGEIAALLERVGLADAALRLESERTERDAARAPSEWRHMTLPLFDGRELRPIDIHARRRRGDERQGKRDQTRFVVQCTHDDWGEIQIDGLMTSAPSKRRLDVILRTHAPIEEADRAALAGLYADACGAMGLSGELAFQTLLRFPQIVDDAPHRDVVA
jgi:hypothetical protein